MKRILSIALSLIMLLPLGAALPVSAAENTPQDTVYEIPQSPNVDYNFNPDWKFYMPDYPEHKITTTDDDGNEVTKTTDYWLLQDSLEIMRNEETNTAGLDFFDVDYDDSAWEDVSLPHTYNTTDIFDGYASGSGESNRRGVSFYRKHFTLDAKHKDQKIILEFEGIRQSLYLWVNGQPVGFYSLGVSPFAFDITNYVDYDGDNLIAVATDSSGGGNTTYYQSETKPGSDWGASDGVAYRWNSAGFNPPLGGITRNVILHTKNRVYQTLPLYSNLKTHGAYVYGSDFDVENKSATINVETEIRNESEDDTDVTVSVDVVDKDGNLQWSFDADTAVTVTPADDRNTVFESLIPETAYDYDDYLSDEAESIPTDTSTVEVTTVKASAEVNDIRLWSPDDPYLYDVYINLKDSDGNILDTTKVSTGFRKTELKGGADDGGVYINDKYYYLAGYAQRASQEWAAIGCSTDWLEDYDMSLVRESNANHIRWMHISAHPSTVRACDKYGIVIVQPAADGEGDMQGRQWRQRTEIMRDSILYFRNSPSIIFWEAGNARISSTHMQEMTDLRKELDPNGGRAMGCRSLGATGDESTVTEEDKAAVAASEYVGTMLGRNVEDGSYVMRGYSDTIIATKPILESEYYREEAPRRVWDDYSAPWYDYVHNAAKKNEDTWDLTSEQFIVNNVEQYNHFYSNRIASNSSRPTYSGAAALCWSDSMQHGRNYATENGRMSGRVDPIRIKKQSYYAYQTMQSSEPSVYLLGHWNYSSDPDDYPEGIDPTNKTVYVIASHCKYVELYVDGERIGRCVSAKDGFLYTFEGVDVTKTGGYIEAIGYNSKGEALASHKIETAGDAAEIRLTPVTGPDGLLADGSDVAFFDLEVVDSEGRVLPTDYSKINLSVTGDAALMGGYNSGCAPYNDTSQEYPNQALNTDPTTVYTECGTNRIFVKAGRTAGTITLQATAPDLGLSASATVESESFEVENGLTTVMPQSENPHITPKVTSDSPTAAAMIPLTSEMAVKFGEGGNTYIVQQTDNRKYITVSIDGEETDIGAYHDNSTVYGDLITFAEKVGASFTPPDEGTEFDKVIMEITLGDNTVRISNTNIIDSSGAMLDVLGQPPEWKNGTIYIDLIKIADNLGISHDAYTSDMTAINFTTAQSE